MRTLKSDPFGLTHRLYAGDDVSPVLALAETGEYVSLDTETTGLRIFNDGFAVRLVQLGDKETAYVWEPRDFPDLTRQVFDAAERLYLWNATFDILALSHLGYVDFDVAWGKARDAMIIWKMIDPRAKFQGGIGQSLKDVSSALLELPEVADARDKVRDAAHAEGWNVSEMWANISIDNDVYVSYAGQDVLLTSSVAELIEARAVEVDVPESKILMEHELLKALATMTRKGWATDVEYAEKARAKYQAEFDAAEDELGLYGIPKSNNGKGWRSTAKAALTERFTELSVDFADFTEKGAVKLDKAVLSRIARDEYGEAKEIATLVLKAKRAAKLKDVYIKAALDFRGSDGRVHAVINSLAATTGRMSVQDPALQQLPRKPGEPRGCYIPDEGHVIVSIDYSSVEWKIAGAVTGDEAMQRKFKEGADIHLDAARMMFGAHVQKGDPERQTMKTGTLAYLYGAGIPAIARQCGLTKEKAKHLVASFAKLYPRVQETREYLGDTINGPTPLRLPSGRMTVPNSGHLALNYLCQGPARDVLAEAVVRLHRAGFGAYMLCVVHDEIVFSFPRDDAERLMWEAKSLMDVDFGGVLVDTEAEILGDRWRK